VADTDNTDDNNEVEKYSLGSVKTYFRNLMKTNSYNVAKTSKRKSPLPDIVKEFFTPKTCDEENNTETSVESQEEEEENLLDDGDYFNSFTASNSFTNLQLRLIDDSLEEAEERFEHLVTNNDEKKVMPDQRSFTFSFDEESIAESCFGKLQLEEIDMSDEIELSDDDDAETDSESDAIVDHLEEDEELAAW